MARKPILCLDFDGVIHSYSSGWQGADIIPDPPVPGAVTFIARAVEKFTVSVFSSRSCQHMGIEAMRFWLKLQFYREMEAGDADPVLAQIEWSTEKPPALVTIDDRALTFTGQWTDYDLDNLAAFQPWNKQPVAPVEEPTGSTEDLIAVPRGYLAAASYAIRKSPHAGGETHKAIQDLALHGLVVAATNAGQVQEVARRELANVDQVNANCPANRTRLGDKLCPTCQAGPDEGCRKDILAMYQLVTELRAALAQPKGDTL